MSLGAPRKPAIVMLYPNPLLVDCASSTNANLNLRAAFSSPSVLSEMDIGSNESTQTKAEPKNPDNDLQIVQKQSSSFLVTEQARPVSDYIAYRHKLMLETLRKQYKDQQPPGNVILNSIHFNSISVEQSLERSVSESDSTGGITEVYAKRHVKYFEPLEHFLLRNHDQKPDTSEASTTTKDESEPVETSVKHPSNRHTVVAKTVISESHSNPNKLCKQPLAKNRRSKFTNSNAKPEPVLDRDPSTATRKIERDTLEADSRLTEKIDVEFSNSKKEKVESTKKEEVILSPLAKSDARSRDSLTKTIAFSDPDNFESFEKEELNLSPPAKSDVRGRDGLARTTMSRLPVSTSLGSKDRSHSSIARSKIPNLRTDRVIEHDKRDQMSTEIMVANLARRSRETAKKDVDQDSIKVPIKSRYKAPLGISNYERKRRYD